MIKAWLTNYRQLPRNIWLLGMISLLNDSASELVYPLLPLYLAAVLINAPRWIGIIEGIAEAVASLAKLASAVVSDWFSSRKWSMLLGYTLPALARPAFALVASAPAILVLRLLDRVGKALRSAPRDALLANSVKAEQRALAFGLHRAMDHLGATIGPLLAWILIFAGAPIQQVLLWALLPGILCVLLAAGVQESEPARPSQKPSFNWGWSHLSPEFRRYLLALACFSLGNSSNMFLLLRAKETGLSDANVLLCWAAMNLIATLLTPVLTPLSDRFGRLRLLRMGWLFYVVIYLFFAILPNSFLALIFAFASMGLFAAATEGVEKAFVADLLDRERAATSFGWFYLAGGLPLLPASFCFGELSTRISPVAAFLFSAACALLGTIILSSIRVTKLKHS